MQQNHNDQIPPPHAQQTGFHPSPFQQTPIETAENDPNRGFQENAFEYHDFGTETGMQSPGQPTYSSYNTTTSNLYETPLPLNPISLEQSQPAALYWHSHDNTNTQLASGNHAAAGGYQAINDWAEVDYANHQHHFNGRVGLEPPQPQQFAPDYAPLHQSINYSTFDDQSTNHSFLLPSQPEHTYNQHPIYQTNTDPSHQRQYESQPHAVQGATTQGNHHQIPQTQPEAPANSSTTSKKPGRSGPRWKPIGCFFEPNCEAQFATQEEKKAHEQPSFDEATKWIQANPDEFAKLVDKRPDRQTDSEEDRIKYETLAVALRIHLGHRQPVQRD